LGVFVVELSMQWHDLILILMIPLAVWVGYERGRNSAMNEARTIVKRYCKQLKEHYESRYPAKGLHNG
jgi:hypothetical protein